MLSKKRKFKEFVVIVKDPDTGAVMKSNIMARSKEELETKLKGIAAVDIQQEEE